MPRLIRHDATGPFEVKPQTTSVWICMCGLSQKYPFCDGSHKKCRTEAVNKVYTYNSARTQVISEAEDTP